MDSEKCPKTFFKVLGRENLQNHTICELYSNDNKSKYSANRKDIFKYSKINYETLYIKETTSKAATEFLTKIPNRKKTSNEQLNFCKVKISLGEIIKPINSQKNESPGKFYKYFSKELAPVLLDVYDSLGKLGTMNVISRTGIISVIYKKGDTKEEMCIRGFWDSLVCIQKK